MNEPSEFVISSREWWFKVLGMLNENWALIEDTPEKATVYFFHSSGMPTMSIKPRNGPWSAIVDSLEFSDWESAANALSRNGFTQFSAIADAWEGNPPPEEKFYDAREKEPGIYSKQGYWDL